jgi:hypothetical protein
MVVLSSDGAVRGVQTQHNTLPSNKNDPSFVFLVAVPEPPIPSPRFIYASVNATDAANWTSPVVRSVTVKYDVHKPVVPLNVVDDLDGDGSDALWSRRQGVACVRYDLGESSTAFTVQLRLGTAPGLSDAALSLSMPINATRPSWYCFPPSSLTLVSNTTYYSTVVATTECSGMSESSSSSGFLFDTLPPVADLSGLLHYDRTVSPRYAWESAAGVTPLSLVSALGSNWNVSWAPGAVVGMCTAPLYRCAEAATVLAHASRMAGNVTLLGHRFAIGSQLRLAPCKGDAAVLRQRSCVRTHS